MKKLLKIFYCNVALLLLVLLLVGCTDNAKESSTAENGGDESAAQTEKEIDGADSTSESAGTSSNSEFPDATGSISASSDEATKKQEAPLSQYTSEEIEYARIWLQLGPNQDIDELYVQHIPAGTPLNPDDPTSGSYPEDVIQLSGTRLVDGSITYSGNGDGTINVYNAPLRWDGKYPAGETFYKEIAQNTKQVYIQPSNDEKVIKLIDKLHGIPGK